MNESLQEEKTHVHSYEVSVEAGMGWVWRKCGWGNTVGLQGVDVAEVFGGSSED